MVVKNGKYLMLLKSNAHGAVAPFDRMQCTVRQIRKIIQDMDLQNVYINNLKALLI